MDILNTIISNGYSKQEYGYVKSTKENTHWITIFEDKLQMYAYFTDDESCEKIYDTGIVNISSSVLQTLINILN